MVLCYCCTINGSRGSTPLHKVTRHLRSELHAARSNQSQPQSQPQAPVCYNIVTDGEPNNRRAFEDELRIMAMGAGRDQSSSSASSVFLTINLCTDEDSVVDYYNDLDKKLGNNPIAAVSLLYIRALARVVVMRHTLVHSLSRHHRRIRAIWFRCDWWFRSWGHWD